LFYSFSNNYKIEKAQPFRSSLFYFKVYLAL